MQLLHEAGMFLYTWNTEGLGLSTDSVNKVVVRYRCCADGTLDLGGVAERDSFIDGLERN